MSCYFTFHFQFSFAIVVISFLSLYTQEIKIRPFVGILLVFPIENILLIHCLHSLVDYEFVIIKPRNCMTKVVNHIMQLSLVMDWRGQRSGLVTTKLIIPIRFSIKKSVETFSIFRILQCDF